ncbi:MAG: hypothetical protein MUF10_03590, partial [Thermoanaerobaculaceae bacterium]|nr:hypothetical protein [Thermoanaerobaculaceae bacterium]
MSTPVRRHALIGLAVAGLAGVLAAWFLLGAGRRATVAFRAERETVVRAQALAELVTRAGLQGDQVRQVVARFTAGDSTVRSTRVILLEGLSLEASTFSEDVGEKAAPRRLQKEEKPLYDQGQRLRAAADTNREDQASMKEEIEVSPMADGSLDVAVPLLRDGVVVGFLQLVTAPPAGAAPTAPWWPALLSLLLPLALFAAAATVLPERRLVLTLAGLVLLIAGLLGFQRAGARTLGADRHAAEEAVAAHAVAVGARASALAGELGLAGQPFDPSAWDVTVFSKPYGLFSSTGQLDSGRVQAALGATAANWRSLFWLLGGFSGLLLLFFSTGTAARLWATLVTHRSAYFYVSPAMVGMLLLVFFPFFYGIALSFTGSTIYNSDKSIPEIWVGVKNYTEIISDVKVAQHSAGGWAINNQNF